MRRRGVRRGEDGPVPGGAGGYSMFICVKRKWFQKKVLSGLRYDAVGDAHYFDLKEHERSCTWEQTRKMGSTITFNPYPALTLKHEAALAPGPQVIQHPTHSF